MQQTNQCTKSINAKKTTVAKLQIKEKKQLLRVQSSQHEFTLV